MTSGNKQERREWWAVYDNQEKQYVSIPELFVSQPLAEKYDKPFKVTELKPGERVISRERLREAFDKAYMMPWDDRDGLFDAMASVLFGAEKDTREG